jgi:hypothetical protein
MAIAEDRQLTPPYQLLVGESARAFFEELIQPDWRIFEWGLGPGSLWFAALAAHVVSVENVTEWYNYVNLVRGQHYLHNLTIKLVAGCKNVPGWRDALNLYVEAIDGYPDNHFDLVFSDGWAESRALCPVRAMTKVRPGGWIVVDDVNWNPAKVGAEPLVEAGWRQVRKAGIVPPEASWDEHGRKTTTAFFQRPE